GVLTVEWKRGGGMDRFVERCAGLDVHKDSVAATVRVPGGGRERLQETRTFSTTTRGLVTLADWLASYGVTLVGMESTGCYWKPAEWSGKGGPCQEKVLQVGVFGVNHPSAARMSA